MFELQSIPFSYALIARTTKKDRQKYFAKWDKNKNQWLVINK
jgi:hypothetical protein